MALLIETRSVIEARHKLGEDKFAENE